MSDGSSNDGTQSSPFTSPLPSLIAPSGNASRSSSNDMLPVSHSAAAAQAQSAQGSTISSSVPVMPPPTLSEMVGVSVKPISSSLLLTAPASSGASDNNRVNIATHISHVPAAGMMKDVQYEHHDADVHHDDSHTSTRARSMTDTDEELLGSPAPSSLSSRRSSTAFSVTSPLSPSSMISSSGNNNNNNHGGNGNGGNRHVAFMGANNETSPSSPAQKNMTESHQKEVSPLPSSMKESTHNMLQYGDQQSQQQKPATIGDGGSGKDTLSRSGSDNNSSSGSSSDDSPSDPRRNQCKLV
jgi:hypothetical protein